MEENQYELIQKFLENGFEFGLLNHELKDKLLIVDNQLSLKSNPETLYYTLNFLKGFDFFFEENTNNCTVKGKLIFTDKKEHEILMEIGLSAFGKGKSIIESVKNGIENLISGNILFEENSKVVYQINPNLTISLKIPYLEISDVPQEYKSIVIEEAKELSNYSRIWEERIKHTQPQ